MKKIALVIGGKVLAYSPIMLNLINFLARKSDLNIYYCVNFDKDIIREHSKINFFYIGKYNEYNLRVFFSNIYYYYCYYIKRYLKISLKCRHRQFYYKKSFVFFLVHFIKEMIFRKTLKYKNHDLYINFDASLFLLCKKIFPKSSPIYYCLELYLKNDSEQIKRMWIEEMRYIFSIKGLIIQSEERKNLFIENYNLKKNLPTFILPATYDTCSTPEKSDYLRNKFDIDRRYSVALHLGGITYESECCDLVKEFQFINDWILILHGYSEYGYLDKVTKYLVDYGVTNVIINNEFFNSINDFQKVVKSADVGIAWYKNLSANYYTAGNSSGKIANYFKCGLPVITNNYPSCIDAVEAPGAGVCISDFKELTYALNKINANYKQYSLNSLNLFNKKYKFDMYKKGLEKFLLDEK